MKNPSPSNKNIAAGFSAALLRFALVMAVLGLAGCGGGHNGAPPAPVAADRQDEFYGVDAATGTETIDRAAAAVAASCVTKATFSDSGQALGGAVPNLPNAPNARALFSADIDGNGSKDIIAGSFGKGVSIYTNDGKGNFTLKPPVLRGNQAQAIYSADIDRDGDNDIIVGDFKDGIIVHRNRGNGVFDVAQTIAGIGVSSIGVADLDGKNGLDIVAANFKTATKICLNNGSGFFVCSGSIVGSTKTKSIVVVDVDKDGKPDVIQSNYYLVPDRKPLSETLKVWKNNGSGGFTLLPQTGLGLLGINSIIATDVDKDGDPDILVSSYLGGPGAIGKGQLLLNDGTGRFANAGLSGANVWSSDIVSFVTADFDGDTYPDIINSNYVGLGAYDELWYNDGAGKFIRACDNAGVVSKSWTQFAVDVDGDGDIDIVDGTATTIKIWINGRILATAKCLSDSQCLAATPATPFCVNPGTIQAACVVCKRDLDCDDANIITTDTCVAPSTTAASCLHVACAVACSSDSACNDSNMMTIDTCSNPATCGASCSNTRMNLSVGASVNRTSGTTQDAYTLTCSASGGNVQLWETRCSATLPWTALASGNSRVCSYATAGTYVPSCRANVEVIANASQVVVTNPNLPPVATATANRTAGVPPLAVQFTGGCVDTDGTCASYSWNFGDNTAVSALQNPSHTYTSLGTYTATLTVTDNRGATARATVVITLSNSACFNDSNCDDGNIYTIDTCVNPGQANASCSHWVSYSGLADVTVNANPIMITMWDNGSMQDGDEVTVVFNGTVIYADLSLLFAGTSRSLTLQPGLNVLEVIALNEGSSSPNTAGLRISNVTQGQANQGWNLNTGQSAGLRILYIPPGP